MPSKSWKLWRRFRRTCCPVCCRGDSSSDEESSQSGVNAVTPAQDAPLDDDAVKPRPGKTGVPKPSFFSSSENERSQEILKDLKKLWPRVIIDHLVLQTLDTIRFLVDNEQEPPASMMRLHAIADQVRDNGLQFHNTCDFRILTNI